MGLQQSQPIQLEPGPGFQKRKANTFPGYESYDFGGYEIWGPYKKQQIPGLFGIKSWYPKNKSVDGADLLELCVVAQEQLKPRDRPSEPTLLRSYTPFSTKPDVGTDRPACYQDNMGLTSEDDGLFYIHYKHPMFARIIRDSPFSRTGISGLLPTYLQSKKLNQAKNMKSITNVLRQRPTGAIWDMSKQNLAEAGLLLYKSGKALQRTNVGKLPLGIQIPLAQAVLVINTSAAIFNFGQKRTLNGGKRKRLIKRATRKVYKNNK